MISTVQTPCPVLAAIAPSDWPHLCAPSPESLTISTTCSVSLASTFSREDDWRAEAVSSTGCDMDALFIAAVHEFFPAALAAHSLLLSNPDAAKILLTHIDTKQPASRNPFFQQSARGAIANSQILPHAGCRLPPCTHGFDHCRGAGDNVPARKNAGHRCLQILIDFDVAPLVQPNLGGLANNGIRVCSDSKHHLIDLQHMLASGDRYGAGAAGFVGFSKRHPHATHGADLPLIVTEDLHRVCEPVKFNSLLFGVMDLLRPRGALGPAPPVYTVDLLCAKPQTHP